MLVLHLGIVIVIIFFSNCKWCFIFNFSVQVVTASIHRNKIDFYMLILCPAALVFCSSCSDKESLIPCLHPTEAPHYPPLHLLSLSFQAVSCSSWMLTNAPGLALLMLCSSYKTPSFPPANSKSTPPAGGRPAPLLLRGCSL